MDAHHHHLSHSATSLASGRRVHTIPIRVEGRSRPASCPPPTAVRQRVYEIPVNVVSAPSKDKASTSPGAETVKSSQVQFDDAERKLASLMTQLETDMSATGTGSPAHKQLSEISLTPVSMSSGKSPPPYHGPHITEFFRRPAHVTAQPVKSSTGVASVAEAGAAASPPGTPVRTVAVAAESVERYGEWSCECSS